MPASLSTTTISHTHEYASGDVQPVKENEKYAVDVEVRHTNIMLKPNESRF